jgi:hypothetical protein
MSWTHATPMELLQGLLIVSIVPAVGHAGTLEAMRE